jgi:ethanolamine permease
MIIMWNLLGGEDATALIGSVLLNMAVFGAMLSYIFRAISYIVLRARHSGIARPYRSPFGMTGAVVTIAISLVTLYFQIQDPNFSKGIVWVLVWFGVALVYFGLFGRHRLVLSPEEAFALEQQGERP